MKKKTRVSMRDIAKACGVSVATVSRVFNDHAYVKDEVRKKISAYIEKHDYDPYRNIPLLKKIQQRTIRVIMPYAAEGVTSDPFYSKALAGLRKAADSKAYDVVLTTEDALLKTLGSGQQGVQALGRDAGFIFVCPMYDWEEPLEGLLKAERPVAVVHRRSRHKQVISVMEKREEGIRNAVEHLVNLGYRDIAGVALVDPDVFTFKRLKKAFKALELNCGARRLFPVVDRAKFKEEDLIASFHEKGDMPEALIILSDVRAIAAMKALQQRGYRIPEDVAVVGSDNVVLASYYNPALTSIDVPVDRSSGMAVTMVTEQAESGVLHGMSVELEDELIIRDSCGYHLKNG